MTAANHLEVVQTEEGDIVLRRRDDDAGEPLVALRFSAEVRAMLGSHLGEVALAMLGAGMQATRHVLSAGTEAGKPPLLH